MAFNIVASNLDDLETTHCLALCLCGLSYNIDKLSVGSCIAFKYCPRYLLPLSLWDGTEYVCLYGTLVLLKLVILSFFFLNYLAI